MRGPRLISGSLRIVPLIAFRSHRRAAGIVVNSVVNSDFIIVHSDRIDQQLEELYGGGCASRIWNWNLKLNSIINLVNANMREV